MTIDFNFIDSGYTSPDFNKISFDFGSGTRITDLQNQIVGMAFERDYLKSCKTYVVGYGQNNVQLLKQDCIYGGIRDLGVTVDAALLIGDISFYIKSTISSAMELNALVKGASSEYTDLFVITKGRSLENPLDLPVYLKQGYSSSTDFSSYIKTFLPSAAEISSILKGWKRSESEILLEIIKGYASVYKALPSYIKPTQPSSVDLTLDIFKIWQHNDIIIPFSIHGWQEVDLIKYICAISYKNLPIYIRSTYLYDLAATMVPVPPVDISFGLYGWAVNDVNLSIAYARSPNDLEFSIKPVSSINLQIILKSFLETEAHKDLLLGIQSYYTTNLNAFLTSVPAADLSVSIFPKSATVNLGAVVYPKIVYVRTIMSISYLECLDLAASVNPSCFNSSYRDLSSRLYSIHNKNLRAAVFGTDGSNIIDLSVFINDYGYYEEETLKLSLFKGPEKTTSVKLSYSNTDLYFEKDVLTLKLPTLKVFGKSNLSAIICGKHFQKDLGVFVRAYTPRSYEASTVKKKFITLKLNHSNIEEWRRHIEITFNDYVSSYYYFDGDKKVYKEFVDDQWVVQVKGYSLSGVPVGMDRTKINRKYIFNLKRYASIDAAIKDMIDRVTALKENDLSCHIECEPKKEANLSMSIASRAVYKSNRVLPVIINSN